MSESGKHIDPSIELRIRDLVSEGLVGAATEKDCAARHDRTNGVALDGVKLGRAAKNRLISIAGEEGKSGRLGDLEGDLRDHEKRLTAVEKAVWKLLIAAASGAGLAKAIEAAIGAATGGQ